LNLTHSITDAGTIGCIVNSIALLAFLKQPTLRKLFPAMAVYLSFKFISDVALISLMQVHHLFAPTIMYDIYFTIYWLSFLVGSVALFYAVRQAFDHLMEPLQGLKKVGQVVFRWIAIVSMIVVAATALHPYGFSMRAIPLAMIELMRCTSMLELFLLAFLALTVHRLGLSTVSLLGEIGSICAFLLWSTYFLISEPARRSLMMPATSQLLRWNEIALALGHSGGQVVMTPAPKPFFLDEVEKTVDRVLSRNSIDAN
jgi:hypothetical protein